MSAASFSKWRADLEFDPWGHCGNIPHLMGSPAITVPNEAPRLGWKDLFSPAADCPRSEQVEVIVLRRGGEPLLVLPSRGRAGVLGMKLYAAQTPLARLARLIWTGMLRWGMTLGLERDRLVLDPQCPFLEYLRQSADTAGLPQFALLAGNPHSPGRRFLLLVVDAQGRPAGVVKVGAEPAAVALIERELSFLDSVPAGVQGLPKVRHRFADAYLRAFTMDLVDGDSPRLSQQGQLARLLTSWLRPAQPITVAHIPAWTVLVRACGADDRFLKLARELERVAVRPVLFHGDFAPWNVKVLPADGSWTALDWERGELVGPPAWDWFHFVTQTSILVERQSASALIATAERLLDSAPFRSYSQALNLTGRERVWFLAYLFHCREVLGQSRTLPPISRLLDDLAARWLNR